MEDLYRVVIVDDEMLIRQGIINYIDWESQGFRIVGEASNGKEALQLVDELHPHLLITDIVMPGMNGIELVKAVKERHPSVEIIVLSSFENFDYVRSAFQFGIADYILKPKLNGEELIRTLNRISPNTADNPVEYEKDISLEDLLRKKLEGQEWTAEEEEKLQAFPQGAYTLLGLTETRRNGGNSALISLHQKLSEEGAIKGIEWIADVESDFNVALLIYDSLHTAAVQERLVRFSDEYEGVGDRAPWVVSAPFFSLKEVGEVYRDQVIRLKEYAFYMPEAPILMEGLLPDLERKERPFDLSGFIDRFKQRKFDTAIQNLRRHLDALTSDYTLDIFEFKSWMENVIFNSIVLLGNMKYPVDDLETLKYEYFAVINEAGNVNDAVAPFYDFLEKVQVVVQEDTQRECPTDVQRLLQYIEEHYAEPLSLTTLANYFHFNASYLSTYFSTHLHIGFSDYLNKVRIEKAKRLLESTNTPVSEVSEQVGYSDPSYFGKVFKRLVGSSPGKYRKKAMAAN
ncbi:response regulator transcription factor [Halobacillus sp. ACCC02827]|uniref:response regulator transcription factor n=1 Tax=unclassified Halobacillus TaxID=2636472 RepID=UPI000784E7B7|nr:MULTISPECIES: response regulator transcription factor [unclassified Halobacillus]WJE16291.1 response regulator transcription factor [Halobacillus sp. ACCC02827]